MERFPLIVVLAVVLSLAGAIALPALEVYQGVESGYYDDVAVLVRFSFRELSETLPVGVRVVAGAVYQFDSGDGELSLLAYGGPRGSFYSAHYTFFGNNEAFAIHSNAFGAGGGLAAVLKMGARTTGVLNAGVDYFFPAKLYGHGTFYYTPDGVDQNPRHAYTYEDADAAVNQPKLVPAITLGVEYRLD